MQPPNASRDSNRALTSSSRCTCARIKETPQCTDKAKTNQRDVRQRRRCQFNGDEEREKREREFICRRVFVLNGTRRLTENTIRSRKPFSAPLVFSKSLFPFFFFFCLFILLYCNCVNISSNKKDSTGIERNKRKRQREMNKIKSTKKKKKVNDKTFTANGTSICNIFTRVRIALFVSMGIRWISVVQKTRVFFLVTKHIFFFSFSSCLRCHFGDAVK